MKIDLIKQVVFSLILGIIIGIVITYFTGNAIAPFVCGVAAATSAFFRYLRYNEKKES